MQLREGGGCWLPGKAENDDVERKGKIRSPAIPVPLSPSLFISKTKVELVGRTFTLHKVK